MDSRINNLQELTGMTERQARIIQDVYTGITKARIDIAIDGLGAVKKTVVNVSKSHKVDLISAAYIAYALMVGDKSG